MAKRYHQSKKDRRDESRGMMRYESRMSEESGYGNNGYGKSVYGNNSSTGEGMIRHHRDRFNDEEHHDQDPRNGSMGFRVHREPYAGIEARRHMEMQDAGMIRDDMSQIANLPQNVVIKAYPKTGPYLPEGLNDDISGVDMQMDYDDSQRRSHFYPKKI